MALDVSQFHSLIVADTCAVWNVLSCTTLHGQSVSAGCHYSITDFVLYECLYKPRKSLNDNDRELQQRLRKARERGEFANFGLIIDDLQDVALLERRRSLSKGELTAIAFAKKTRQAFLTDDKGARSLALGVLDQRMVQTTPHLLGWLVFRGRLRDGDIPGIVEEHKRLRRPLAQFFVQMYEEAMRCRLLIQTPPKSGS